jgi:hypothetical protein
MQFLKEENSYQEKERRFFQDQQRATKYFERHETGFRWIRKTDWIRIPDRHSSQQKRIASFLWRNSNEEQPAKHFLTKLKD